MKPVVNKFAVVLGTILVGMLLSGNAFARCGDYANFKPSALLLPQFSEGQLASLLPVSASSSDDSIVGMWHATLTAEGNELGPPDGAPIDNALVVMHSDGTDVMNSNRPPQDGNFCLGVWKKVGKRHYKINHIAWSINDTQNAPSEIGNPSGPIRIYQELTLSPDGNHYTGTFTLDAYDTFGNVVLHIVGVVNATRVTLSTTVPDLL
jgi:hypothetical protein